MTDFTPGPYVAAEFEHPQPGEYWATIKATGDVWIADVYAVDDAVTPDQAKANALLLTEAPEMHTALADLVERIELNERIVMRDLMPARRALAHVRGECYQDSGRPCEIHTALGTRRTS